MTYVLWSVQALLALVFVFAGGMKLVMPIEELTAQIALPGAFVRFIGVCEVAGALGLVLPGLLKIKQHLTPLAAKGLVLIMVGAVMFTPPDNLSLALIPAVIGALAGFVAYGRSHVTTRQRRPRLQPAS